MESKNDLNQLIEKLITGNKSDLCSEGCNGLDLQEKQDGEFGVYLKDTNLSILLSVVSGVLFFHESDFEVVDHLAIETKLSAKALEEWNLEFATSIGH